MLTVQTCIENLNQEGFYTKKIQNSIFKNINIAICYLSIIQYEKTIYKQIPIMYNLTCTWRLW